MISGRFGVRQSKERGAGAWLVMLFLLIIAGGFGAAPAMAAGPCAGETWTVSPTSFHFPASVDPQAVFTINVSNSPVSTFCHWTMAVLSGTDSSWYIAT